jgi:hypothetical protein
LILNISELTHENNSILVVDLHIATSKKAINANNVVNNKHIILMIKDPLTPNDLPNIPLNIAPKKGKSIITKYILKK